MCMSGESRSSNIGVHALVFAGSWGRAAATAAIKGAQACGYDFIEIPLLDPSSVDTAMTREILQAYGIIATASLGLSLDADVSSADKEISLKGEQKLLQALDVVVGIGSPYMCGILYSALAKYNTPPTAEGRANAVAALKRVARVAADKGVTLGLEVVNRYESNLLNTALQAMDFIEDVNVDNVMVHLDSYHMHLEEASLASAVYTCGDRLGYVHIGESHRGYLGSGSVNFAELFRALEEIGYKSNSI